MSDAIVATVGSLVTMESSFTGLAFTSSLGTFSVSVLVGGVDAGSEIVAVTEEMSLYERVMIDDGSDVVGLLKVLPLTTLFGARGNVAYSDDEKWFSLIVSAQ